MIRKTIACAALISMSVATTAMGRPRPLPSAEAIDARVAAAMNATGARSVAIAVIDRGPVQRVKAYGVRNSDGAPLADTSIMYGASLTKAVFGYFVLKLVDAGQIGLDTPIERYLPKPLSDYTDADMVRKYGDFSLVAQDPRWHKLTPRILLNHASGLVNIPPDEPDGKLRIHFEPGARYAYSGMGLLLLQLVIEQGIGLDVATELQSRVFDPLGMKDTSLTWRADFQGRAASGWSLTGEAPGHARQSRVAGSMDTTINDMARFAAAMVSGRGLSRQSRRELSRPQLAITTESQFPTLQPEASPARRYPKLAIATAVLSFVGPQGRVFEKGGHNDLTGNTMFCVVKSQRCVVILGADVRFEAAFPALTRFILADTGFPWSWIYSDIRIWQPVSE